MNVTLTSEEYTRLLNLKQKYRKKAKRFKRKYVELKREFFSSDKDKQMIKRIINEFHDYQVEWLTLHNDIEFCKEEEDIIVEWLHQTADVFIKEKTWDSK